MNIILSVSICLAVAIQLLWLGFYLGSTNHNLRRRLKRLEVDWQERQTDEDVSAVVDISPRAMNERQQIDKIIVNEEESQIIRAKTPQQRRADKERREREELDKITNSGIR